MDVSAVVLGFGAEADLEACLRALTEQTPAPREVLLVDNGVADLAARAAATTWPQGVRILSPGRNTGFAGGCHVGVEASSGEVVVLVNSDAVVRPGALAALAATLADPTVGVAGGCLRLADAPELVNSAGNPLHFTGVTWAGACGEPAAAHTTPGPVAIATGGLLGVTRAFWDELGGFDPLYFAYHEDSDLCVRTWLAGRTVRFVPDAVADHRYEFARNPRKMYLLERNRLLTVLADYPPALLRAVLPALVVVEPLLLVQAVLQGWGPQKLRSWLWLVRHHRLVRARRRRVQAAARRGADALAPLLVGRIEPPMVSHPPGMSLVNAALDAYWRRARRGLLPPGGPR